MNPRVSSLQFFSQLRWLDGRPLLDTIEPYRRDLFRLALDTFDNGKPRYNLVLSGRAKKNWKSADLSLAALFCLLFRDSDQGSDCFIIANDEDQAGDDLDLCKKLVRCNPALLNDVKVHRSEIVRHDGKGVLRILPGGDAIGAHGKTACFIGWDEIHGFKNWDALEALQPDPTRDMLQWITSYDCLAGAQAGTPLYDLKQMGMQGDDSRMLFSWYSGEFCTDPAFRSLPPEQRANPSMASWPDAGYLAQQRRRLPAFKFRRLHLNLPGAASGAFLDPDAVLGAIARGRHRNPPDRNEKYFGFVDMSGGSADDAALAIAHLKGRQIVVNSVMTQTGEPPFNPRHAITRFAAHLKEYRVRTVFGDAYSGMTFRYDFLDAGISYRVSDKTTSELYEEFEPRLNAKEIELPDNPKLTSQLINLVVRGAKVDHTPGQHDDLAAAVAGVCDVAARGIAKGHFGKSMPFNCYEIAPRRSFDAYRDSEGHLRLRANDDDAPAIYPVLGMY